MIRRGDAERLEQVSIVKLVRAHSECSLKFVARGGAGGRVELALRAAGR